MNVYKKIVYFTIGLITVLFFGGLADVFTYQSMPYYENLTKPVVNDNLILMINFFVYCIMAYLIGKSLIKKERRHYYLLWVLLLALELLSVITLFYMHNLYLTFSMYFIMVILAISMLFAYIHSTKYLGFLMLPVTIWYIYLFMYNYAIVMLN